MVISPALQKEAMNRDHQCSFTFGVEDLCVLWILPPRVCFMVCVFIVVIHALTHAPSNSSNLTTTNTTGFIVKCRTIYLIANPTKKLRVA
jgi:hypothetical protein